MIPGGSVRFSLLYEIQRPRPWGERSLYDCFWEALEQVKVAEEAGFDTVWSVEHHFLDQFSVASSPEVWLAAVAQHTSRIRIGHGVRLLPFSTTTRCGPPRWPPCWTSCATAASSSEPAVPRPRSSSKASGSIRRTRAPSGTRRCA